MWKKKLQDINALLEEIANGIELGITELITQLLLKKH